MEVNMVIIMEYYSCAAEIQYIFFNPNKHPLSFHYVHYQDVKM